MVSKENFKYFILLAFISIILYKIIDNPSKFISGIGGIASFLSPFLLGILFALLLDPLVKIFERIIKIPRILNILFGYIVISIIVLVGVKLLIPSLLNTLTQLINDMPYYIQLINGFLNKTISSTEVLESLSPHLQKSINNLLNQSIEILTNLSSNTFEYILSVASVLLNILMGIILSIYMLHDKEMIKLSCKKLLYASNSKKRADNILEFFKMSHDIFYSYIFGKFIDSLIVGIISFIVFKFVIKIEHVMFLCIIIFITNMIPYFGPFIGAIPPIFMTLTYSPVKSLWVAIFILILQQVDGNLIGPKVMGEQVGLSPLWIISAVLIGGALFGFIGVFVSVPIAAVIKSCIDKYIDRRIHFKDSL